MGGIVFIGDELTAAGFRLTGIEVVVAPPEGPRQALAEARQRADFIILTAECARRIPADELNGALLTAAPLVTIIPDILEEVRPPDMARRLRTTLGIES
jgi:vacuolar-type H+-ATPase subunit F/Vma7